MVFIELTRVLIRPVTLSVRLRANITAGHLLLSILVSFVFGLSLSVPFYFLILAMNILELGVAVIQSYVFFVLVRIYMSEA
jgi:F-type H+-transporting ATPase subunit a